MNDDARHAAHDEGTRDMPIEDPAAGWMWYVGVVGCLLLVVSIYYASGLYYGLDRSEAGHKGQTSGSQVLEFTRDQQRARVAAWAVREHGEPPTTFYTQPIRRAMELVQQELREGQGK